VVADERHLEGDAGFERVTQGGAVATIRDRDNDIGSNGKFASEFAAHVDSNLIDIAVGNGAVGPGEIDVFENAKGATLLFGEGLVAVETVLIDHENFARKEVTDKFGVNEVESAGFAGEHPGVVEFAKAQGPKAERIPDTDKLVLSHDDQRIGAFDATYGVDQIVAVTIGAGLGHQMEDNFAIDRCLENRAFGLKLIAKFRGVGQVAIMGNRNLAAGAIHRERLSIADVGGPRRGITSMAHGNFADHVVEDIALENLRDQAHALVGVELPAVGRDYAGAFLSPVLEGIETVVRQFGGVRVSVNAKDSAIMLGIVLHRSQLIIP